MLDMGFREELEAILDTLPKARKSHLVSATFPRGVVELARRRDVPMLALPPGSGKAVAAALRVNRR